MGKNEFVLDREEIGKLKREVNAGEQPDFEQYLEKMMEFFNERKPGSILELTREVGEEDSFSWQNFVRSRLMVMLGTKKDGDVSHPADKNMKITHATDYQDLKVGWILEKDGTQVYQVEFAAGE